MLMNRLFHCILFTPRLLFTVVRVEIALGFDGAL
jgi:hypothetical protein